MAFQDIRNAKLNHSLQSVIKEGNEKEKIIAAQKIKIHVLENQLKNSLTGGQIEKIASQIKQLTDNYRQSLLKSSSDSDSTNNQGIRIQLQEWNSRHPNAQAALTQNRSNSNI